MSSSKENNPQGAEELPSQASPRVSTAGAGGSEDAGGSQRASQDRPGLAQEGYSGFSHDHLHWGGVGRRPHDARSVASSAAADRDDKSVYDQGLDAHDEEEEADHEDDGDEEEPEELTLTQVHDELQDAPLRHESSAPESSFTAASGRGSLADVVDQAVAGELSPRQAAAAIRSATRQHSGGMPHDDEEEEEEGGEGPDGASAAATAADALTAVTLDGSDGGASVTGGAGHSSMAPCEEGGWQGGSARSTGGAVPMENIALDAPPAAQAAAAEAEEAEPEQQQQPRAAEQAAAVPVAAGAEAAPTAEAELPGGVPRTSSSAYRSQLMQQLTASASEDDITVYASPSDAAAQGLGPLGAAAPPAAGRRSNGAAPAAAAVATAASAGAPPQGARASRLEPLSVEGGAPGGAAAAAAGTMSTADTAAALAAINAAAAEQPPRTGEQQPPQVAPLPFPQAWYQTFKGLLYMDGVDALGRPVVVLNADAVPANMKSSALIFVKAHLEPLVNQGDYVLVFTSRGVAKLPSMWIMGAYRSLPRPFRKHVQYIVLVRPSAFLRTVLAFMRPFVSRKASRKIKQVESVHDVAAATGGEVTLQSLGPAFNSELEAAADAAATAGDGSASP